MRYANGEVRIVAQDLSTNAFHSPWGHTRSYSNQLLDSSSTTVNYNGANWFIKELPQVVFSAVATSRVAVVGTVQDTLWFETLDSGATYNGLFFIREKLTKSGSGADETLQLLDTDGRRWRFFGSDALIPAAKRGQFKAYVDAFGNTWTLSYDGSNRPSSMAQASSSTSSTSAYGYSYVASGENAGLLDTVTLTVNGTSVRRSRYTYYTSGGSAGTTGDLRTAVVEQFDSSDSSWKPLNTTYYRYYLSGESGGFEHGLKFAVGPRAYARLVEQGVTPETAPDSILVNEADHYFEYDGSQRVTLEVVQGKAPGHTFGYTSITSSSDYNVAVNKTVETMPDGKTSAVFTNFAGQVTAKVFTSGTDKWFEHYSYDSQGRGLLYATSAAIDSVNESTGEVELNDSAGLIWIYEYYDNTNPAEGYLQALKFKVGDTGTPVSYFEWEYNTTDFSEDGEDIYPVARVSASFDGSTFVDETIAYDDIDEFGAKETTFEWPVVDATTQNGAGGADGNKSYVVYDGYGFPIWTKDERGVIGYMAFDESTGGVVLSIQDVDTSVANPPWSDTPPWTTLPTFGRHLVTNYLLDYLGRRVQELSPEYQVDLGGVVTAVRRVRWDVYLDSEYEYRSAVGYVAPSATVLVNPVTIVRFNPALQLSDTILATQANTDGALSAADIFPQSTWVRWRHFEYDIQNRLVAERSYFDIPDFCSGEPAVQYALIQYGYDGANRVNRVVSPDGVITRTVYHPMGWLLETWVGSADNDATNTEPNPSGALGNDMVKTEARVYDNGLAGGNGLLSALTRYVDGSSANDRLTEFLYNDEEKCVAVDGPEGYYIEYAYNNQGQISEVKLWDGSTSPSSNLRARREMFYDNLGRFYRCIRYGIDQGDGSEETNSLQDNLWYDPVGNLMKVQRRGGRWHQKFWYDSLNRNVYHFYGYNLTEYDDPTYTLAGSVADDTVMHQDEMEYDDGGNLVLQRTRERFHDATALGELQNVSTNPKARVSQKALYFDPIGRLIATVDYGTYGGAAFVRPELVSEPNDLALVTRLVYNERGELFDATDPRGIVTRTEFDDLGRIVETVENYRPGAVSSDANKTIGWTWSPGGLVSTMIVGNASTGNQVTRYLYGTSLGNSDVARPDYLRSVIYPDSNDDGIGTGGVYDRVDFTWNRQGELTQKTDQRGVVNQYEYDKLGRWISDTVASLGESGIVDDSILRIERSFAANGRVARISSLDAASSGDVINEITRTYSPWRQLDTEFQEHSGSVDGSSKKVSYGYNVGADNNVRRTSQLYPSNAAEEYIYGSLNSTDDVLCRVNAIALASSTTVSYEYLGWERRIAFDSIANSSTTWDLYGNGTDSDAGDPYGGLDRFNRVQDIRWSTTISSTTVELERIQYGFDRAANRTWHDSLVAPEAKKQDEFYDYDGLSRLNRLTRGNLNINRTAVNGIPAWEEKWAFDESGNWHASGDPLPVGEGYVQSTDGTVGLDQNRTNNPANEIIDFTAPGVGFAWVAPVYDAAGNLIQGPTFQAPTSSSTSYIYDAWNRLVEAKWTVGGTVLGTYQYDGLGRRISKDANSTIRDFYYSDQWQLLADYNGSSATNPRYRYLWGIRYPDDLVERMTFSGTSVTDRWYAIHDYLHITAVQSSTAGVSLRFGYDAYGQPRLMQDDYSPDSSPTPDDWEFRFGATYWDAETQLYNMRYRYLHPRIGTWMTRDPIGYTEGNNLLCYAQGRPVGVADPLGLLCGFIAFCSLVWSTPLFCAYSCTYKILFSFGTCTPPAFIALPHVQGTLPPPFPPVVVCRPFCLPYYIQASIVFR